MLVAGDIVLEAQRWHPDAIFVDAGNIGAAIIDRLRQLLPDTPVYEVWFGSTKVRQAQFNGSATNVFNKRTEIWTNMREWLNGGAIPDDQGLKDDLTGPLYSFGGDDVSIMLERKKDMKKRGLASPDDGDALGRILRDQSAVEQIRASRAQQEQAQQAAAMMPAVRDGADAAKLLSETDAGGRSALSAMMGQ
ncbi:hypothetical protein [Novosphingobium clariflavum]|uniref:Uncharacterized protein n=1 Tax=Novosphingobium clariflavum TaxID=2029884 RepID=A0ABV6S1D4_9SPHN|nr:hypothetical protein [Novosphingobium clariflavum]